MEVNGLTPARSRKRKGYLHLAMAALTCPCNGLIFLAIFGGTALGAFLNENLSLFLLGLTGIFLLTLFRGLRLIDAGEAKMKP
ncbi:MAG: mercury resistance protein [candidate division NC10 bacterium]